MKQCTDVFSESLLSFLPETAHFQWMLGKSTTVFNSNIVLDCSDCSVSREAVPVSMFTCYYFLNFNTFVTVLNKHFEFQILCLQNCNSYPPSQEQYLLERLSGQRGRGRCPRHPDLSAGCSCAVPTPPPRLRRTEAEAWHMCSLEERAFFMGFGF